MMRRIGITAAILLLCGIPFIRVHAAATTSILTGTLTDSQGNPLNGYLVAQLPVPAQYTPGNIAVSPIPVRFNVVNGAIAGGAPLYDTAALQPQNLYYSINAYDNSGSYVFGGNFVVTGSTFNLGAATPTSILTNNVSYITPASLSGNNVFTGQNTFTQQILSSVATGTAPFGISSTTQVANLNASLLQGATWAVPLAIGSTTPNLGTFTGINDTALSTLSLVCTDNSKNLITTGCSTNSSHIASATSSTSVSASTATSLSGMGLTLSLTMPSSGCPCRVLTSWNLGTHATTATDSGISGWVSDGTNTFAAADGIQRASNSSGVAGSGISPSYANSANVTLTVFTESGGSSAQAYSADQTGQSSGQLSKLSAEIIPSS